MTFKDIFTIKYMSGYYRRNKIITKISLILCILFFVSGFFLFDMSQLNEDESLHAYSDKEYNITEYDDVDERLILKDSNIEGFIELFIHNLSIDLTVVFGGLFLSIPTLIVTSYNVSMFGGIFANIDIVLLITGILPHGIFEMPSSLFALMGGLMITSFELRILRGLFSSHSTVKYEWNNSQRLLKDIILTIVIVFLLLLTAAFIETFITPYLILSVLIRLG